MALVVINDVETGSGELTVTQKLAINEAGDKFILIEGVLVSTKYFEDIHSIETAGLFVGEVYVHQEIFTSESENITYVFEAKIFTRPEEEEEVNE